MRKIHYHVVEEEFYDEGGCFTRTTKVRPMHEADARQMERNWQLQQQAAALKVLQRAQVTLEQRRIANGKAPKYADDYEN